MVWLEVDSVAQLLNKSSRTVQYYAQMGKLESRHAKGRGRGGRVLQIALESLPQEAQDLYNGQLPQPEDIMLYTAKQRHEAELKAMVVEDYQHSALPPDEYIAYHNYQWPDEAVTKPQLFRWQNKFKAGGVAALVDRRGGHNREQSTIPPDAWEYFYSCFMTQQKRSIQLCYELTEEKHSPLPHVSAFERKVKNIPYRAILKYRVGPQAYKNSLPYIVRDYTTIQSNDIWFADEHTMDVFTKNKLGKPTRFYLTLWFDARSRKPLCYCLRDKPADTNVVKETLRASMEEYGVPHALYVDNGMEYKSKDGLNRDYPYSLANRLGIKTIYATPYHGQAKTVERFFNTLEERFGKLWPTYAGRDAKDRPEYLQRPCNSPDKYLAAHAPSEQEFRQAFDLYLQEYSNTKHHGQGMDGRTPNEIYARELKLKRVVSDKDALRLLCGRVEFRTVNRNGITIFERDYTHDALAPLYKQQVMVIYDPANIDEMNIFTLVGEAVCIAKPKILAAFGPTSVEDIKEVKRQQREINKAMKECRPALTMDTYELIAKNQRDEKIYAETGEVPTAEIFNPQLRESRKLEDMKQERSPKERDALRKMQEDLLNSYAKGG